ncbi:MAG: histidine phosphatase family protein [Clostridia bacterium]
MTLRLCLVRHGETQWNAEGRVQGQLDVPLSPIGLAQARAVAVVLGKERFDAIYCSDLLRVRQTAEPTASLLNQDVIFTERLRERHYGVFQGLTYADAKLKLPEDYARFKDKDPDYAFQTGESLSQFNERALAFFAFLVEKHQGQSLLVFTHGGILEMMYRYVTGRGISTPRDFEIPNAALNRLEHDPAGWRVALWADISHLTTALDDLPD